LQASPSNYERGLLNLIEGRLYLNKGLQTEAVQSLRAAKSFFVEDGRDQETMWSRIWLACALNFAGQSEQARAELRDQFASQSQNEHATHICLYQAVFWLENLRTDAEIGRSLGSQLEKAARLANRLPAARRTLRHLAQSIQMPSAGLRIRAFGRADVQVNGRTLTMVDWHTQAVRNLLFYFMVEYRPVTKEQVGAAMWTGIEDSETLQSRFRNDMHRLRRAIGRESIVYTDDYYRFNRALDYEYDVEEFEARLARARSARGEGECIDLFKKAVDMVTGPYLPELDYKWADEERERLRYSHLSALEELAVLYLDANRLAEAVETCQRALQVEPGSESICRIQMRAYSAQGDKPAVSRAFQACEQAVFKIGFTPSEETYNLYRQLVGTEPTQPASGSKRSAKKMKPSEL
jgi:two-component SAPR family response regulator